MTLRKKLHITSVLCFTKVFMAEVALHFYVLKNQIALVVILKIFFAFESCTSIYSEKMFTFVCFRKSQLLVEISLDSRSIHL